MSFLLLKTIVDLFLPSSTRPFFALLLGVDITNLGREVLQEVPLLLALDTVLPVKQAYYHLQVLLMNCIGEVLRIICS